MNHQPEFHVVTVGWDRSLVEGLCDRVSARSQIRFSHVMHPRYVRSESPDLASRRGIHFFRDQLREQVTDPDPRLLASLEQSGLPTIHNMIMGDRVVSRLDYDDALGYATFIARRLWALFGEIKPAVILGGFDAIHGSLAPAVARRLDIPWFALHFSVIPPGLACFCNRISPAARVLLTGDRSASELRGFAQTSLQKFEDRAIQVPAYIAPAPLSLAGRIARSPARLSALARTLRRSRSREFHRFTEAPSTYSVAAAVTRLRRAAVARKAIATVKSHATAPATPYVLFGLHFQPESSIDVWAPFFSNQMWVIELLARSIPPSHKLLVKIHKSDISNYSTDQLRRMCSYPGVELVRPFADTRDLIERADLVISIQGTMGLEAALLGKPVIMLGESPVTVFPSASRIGAIPDLPELIRRKLIEPRPDRNEIIDAYASYLSPFMPASHNDWRVAISEPAIESYVKLFSALRQHVAGRSAIALQTAS
jgi:hypothetical protein